MPMSIVFSWIIRILLNVRDFAFFDDNGSLYEARGSHYLGIRYDLLIHNYFKVLLPNNFRLK